MSDIQRLTATRRVDGDAMGAAIKDIFRTAHSEGRSTLFEHEVYRLLAVAGIASTPRHELLTGGAEPADELLASFAGSRVVVKIVSGSIAHKSDVGGVAVVPKQPGAVRAACKSMLAALSERDVAGLMLTEFIEADAPGSGSELLVGIRNTREFGMILSAGIGGVDTELYAGGSRRGQAVVSASTALTTAEADHCRGISRAFQTDDCLPEDRRTDAGGAPAGGGRKPPPVLRRLHPPREQLFDGQPRDRLRHRGAGGQPLHLLGRRARRPRRLVPLRPAAERPPAAASGQDRQAAAPGFDRNHRCIRHAHELRPDHPEEHHRIRL
ncbi:MAG: acetate--CoA ligase family protein [Proteobacteria bacterium]|nr:acetate--CoA ligase family protein [Pseudomonadota bacterium]